MDSNIAGDNALRCPSVNSPPDSRLFNVINLSFAREFENFPIDQDIDEDVDEYRPTVAVKKVRLNREKLVHNIMIRK